MFDFIIAIILMGVAAIIVLRFLDYKSASSEKRMLQMMQRAGVDPDIVDEDENASTIWKIRRKCRKCQSEDVCEKWLADENDGHEAFCPNAQLIEELKRVGKA